MTANILQGAGLLALFAPNEAVQKPAIAEGKKQDPITQCSKGTILKKITINHAKIQENPQFE
jgi:hypothetical protein